MIEIKITIDTALNMLLNRMKIELNLRQKSGMIMSGLRLENLSYKQLYPVVEAAIFDTVFLLPMDLITSETNLKYIITETVKTLSKIFHHEEFVLFSNNQTKKILEPIYSYLNKQLETKEYENN
jgi:hypothetical protein